MNRRQKNAPRERIKRGAMRYYRETVLELVREKSDQTAIPLRHCSCAVRTREKARDRRRIISSMLALLTVSAGVKRRQSGCGALSTKPSDNAALTTASAESSDRVSPQSSPCPRNSP